MTASRQDLETQHAAAEQPECRGHGHDENQHRRPRAQSPAPNVQVERFVGDENDVLEAARMKHGLERMAQIRYAIQERDGAISIIPEPPAS